MQIITTLCDRHFVRDEKVEADAGTQIIRLNRREVEIDLCYGCLTEVNEMLDEVMNAGRRAGRAVAPIAPPKPDANAGKAKKSGGGKGRVQPDTDDGKFLCRYPDDPNCERQKPENGFDTAQARAMHERQTHMFQWGDWKAAQDAADQEAEQREQEQHAKGGRRRTAPKRVPAGAAT